MYLPYGRERTRLRFEGVQIYSFAMFCHSLAAALRARA